MSVQGGKVGGNRGGSLDVSAVFGNGANLIRKSLVCSGAGLFFRGNCCFTVSDFLSDSVSVGLYMSVQTRQVGEHSAVFGNVVAVGANGADFVGQCLICGSTSSSFIADSLGAGVDFISQVGVGLKELGPVDCFRGICGKITCLDVGDGGAICTAKNYLCLGRVSVLYSIARKSGNAVLDFRICCCTVFCFFGNSISVGLYMSVQGGKVGGNRGGSLDVRTVFGNGTNLIRKSFICSGTGCFFCMDCLISSITGYKTGVSFLYFAVAYYVNFECAGGGIINHGRVGTITNGNVIIRRIVRCGTNTIKHKVIPTVYFVKSCISCSGSSPKGSLHAGNSFVLCCNAGVNIGNGVIIGSNKLFDIK